jgi:hypothetical protein
MPIALSKPCLLLTAIARPDCFEFAMDFLGGTEEAEVRNYIERLESAALAQSEPAPTAWMYQSEPDFDGKHWHENWKTTLDEKLARYMAGKKEPIPLWCSPTPQPEPAPTDDELLKLLSRVSGLPDYDTYIVDGGRIMSEPNELLAYARAVLARWGHA